VGKAVPENGLKPGVEKKDLDRASRRGVAFHDAAYILSGLSKQNYSLPLKVIYKGLNKQNNLKSPPSKIRRRAKSSRFHFVCTRQKGARCISKAFNAARACAVDAGSQTHFAVPFAAGLSARGPVSLVKELSATLFVHSLCSYSYTYYALKMEMSLNLL
jgi:hypothetical protein